MNITKLLSWNVNGIRAVHKKGNLAEVFQLQPDILCIQETKIQPDQLTDDLLNMAGYHAYFESGDRKGYSGVALYSKQEPKELKTGFGIEKFDKEGRIQIADYQDFVLFNIYFPNGKGSKERLQYKMDFYDAFLDYVDRLKDAGRKIVVTGDVNTAHKEIDLARPKENEKVSGFLPEERAWIDKFLSHGYLDTFRMFNQEPGQYTWWDMKSRARERNIGWRIDYFYVSENLKDNVKAAYILPEIMGSDHCPIGIELEI
ncbi:MAG: exodeoxyribonuclease III [candidate division KSB1 bacterium]|nr:exodeoxyribonuclease III [candidate division KSB1 bacterium]MDZ7402309.1 exodeoxyribonuclease III [candidate division KSB1 bacterium]